MSSESAASSDEDEWEPTDADLLPSDNSGVDEPDESPKVLPGKRSKKRPSIKTHRVPKLRSVIKPGPAKQAAVIPKMKSFYFGSEDSSSSSSNEFEQVKGVAKSESSKSKLNERGAAAELEKTAEPQIEEQCDASSKERIEYYDFTSILKSQAELKTVAKQMENYSSQAKSDPSILDLGVDEVGGKAIKRLHDSSKLSKEDVENQKIKKLEIYELLKKCEKSTDVPKINRRRKRKNQAKEADDDMVVVSDLQDSEDDDNPVAHDVQFTIPDEGFWRKKKLENLKLSSDEARKFNKIKRRLYVLLHKVSLLGYLAHGNMLNDLANSEEIRASALSIVPSNNFYPVGYTTLQYIERIMKWFNKHFPLDSTERVISLKIILNDFERKKASNVSSLVVMFAAMCRQLGLKCRIMMSLKPFPLKPPSSETMRVPKETNDDDLDNSWSDVPEKKSKPGPSGVQQKSKKSVGRPSKKKTEKSNRKVLSSDESSTETAQTSAPKMGVDLWSELYDETEKKWVPTDVARAQVNNAMATGNGVTKPLMYVVGWNADGSIKDLTRRYASHWLTTTPKLRVDPSWWSNTLRPWAPRNTKIEREENKELDEQVAATPIPSTINDYKNHPFYALKRHLLKFEAIFPPDAAPIGFIRGEAVFSRVCVTTLHTKETWMRQAKVVRVGEQPYKVVKARPKYDKGTGAMIKDLPLPLFGYWQVENYMPPPAVNGVVPKNDFGNVELYRPSMLPPGTVHLQVPGIPKVAKKLGIDFAPAVVGWEYRGGGSHPVFDGVIICEEFQDSLLDAWNLAIDEDAAKAKQKSRARAVKNWKKLIRSVIIRKRLEKRCKVDLSFS